MHLRQGGPNEMLPSLFCSVSRPSWFNKLTCSYGPCLCIFSKVQDSQKILIFENEALQKAWAVLLIALKTYSSVPSSLAAPRYRNSSTDNCGNRKQEADRDCREVGHGAWWREFGLNICLRRRGPRTSFTEDLPAHSKFRSLAEIQLLSRVKAEFAMFHM